MGLDMYLSGKRYIWNDEDKLQKSISRKFPEVPSKFRPKEVVFELAYWRKANQIHKWFVENVQDGEDNCQEYYVSKKQLEELLQLCQQVIVNREKAEELLPSQAGFFFGDTDYDEYYFNDIQNTINQLQKVLAFIDEGKISIYYQSSW